MKKLLLVAVVLFASYSFFIDQPDTPSKKAPSSSVEQKTEASNDAIANAFANHESNVQVSGQGVVTRLLQDDNNGSRHQKFLIRLPSGQTLLIAHNIDLAPRIKSLREGDSIEFYGEYEWNEKGGVVHWTHHDPNGVHEAGWLQHQGNRYQ